MFFLKKTDLRENGFGLQLLPAVPTNTSSAAVVLDGFDPDKQTLYVRNVDEIGANTFFTLDTSAYDAMWERYPHLLIL